MNTKKILGTMALGAAVTVSSAAFAAGDREFNTAAGAVIGAAIGSQNGTGGAVVGGIVGAAVGNAISSDRHHNRGYVQTRVYAQPQPVYYARPQPVYYEPAPVYYEPPRVRYVEPAPVYVERRVYREYYDEPRHHHHHGRGHAYGHYR